MNNIEKKLIIGRIIEICRIIGWLFHYARTARLQWKKIDYLERILEQRTELRYLLLRASCDEELYRDAKLLRKNVLLYIKNVDSAWSIRDPYYTTYNILQTKYATL